MHISVACKRNKKITADCKDTHFDIVTHFDYGNVQNRY